MEIRLHTLIKTSNNLPKRIWPEYISGGMVHRKFAQIWVCWEIKKLLKHLKKIMSKETCVRMCFLTSSQAQSLKQISWLREVTQ
jgi:hypothetical protein